MKNTEKRDTEKIEAKLEALIERLKVKLIEGVLRRGLSRLS